MAAWVAGWWRQIEAEAADPVARAAAMDAVNPLYIPRNHRVEAALKAAEGGEMASWDRLLDVVRHPYDERAEWQDFTGPAPEDFEPYTTFCRSEEHTSELQSLMRISYAVFCLKNTNNNR